MDGTDEHATIQAGRETPILTRSLRRLLVLPRLNRFPANWFWMLAAVIAALAIGLRLVVLDSDPYARLSWSTALLTDEGFYIHNARNVVLFGTARTDGFNNMLIMPTLHFLQVLVFRLLGVGAIQARLISVGLSLVTLPVFYCALRRVFGRTTAVIATVFLGLDHMNVLYNRMALIDTPATALMICSLYALVRCLPHSESSGNRSVEDEWRQQNVRLAWACLCGCLLGLSFATRSLSAIVIPGFFLAVWTGAGDTKASAQRQHLIALTTGLVVSLTIFAVIWYVPHQSEIAAANRYYLGSLLMPGSPIRLGRNILNGLFEYDRGTMPYLMRHSPIQVSMAITAACWAIATGAGRTLISFNVGGMAPGRPKQAVLALLGWWFAAYAVFLCCVNYAPSRYNVLFYPAIAALAAYVLTDAPRLGREIVERKTLMAVLGSYLLCLLGQTLRIRLAPIDVPGMCALFIGIALAFLTLSVLQRMGSRPVRREIAGVNQSAEIWIVGLMIWAVVNTYWTGDWLLHLSYRQKEADRWLAEHLPPNSTLIGDVAPGLCLNNRFKTINVIPGLANDGAVVEQFGAPRYILILDGSKWREHWWEERYPDLILPSRRLLTFRNLLRKSLDVGVYSVDIQGKRKPPLYLKR